MKFIKHYKTFELKDETYLSAASKLSKNHPERAKRLRKWVDDKQNIDINYIDPRPLNAMGNVYYITDVSTETSTLGEHEDVNIIVELESVNDFYSLVIYNWRNSQFNGIDMTLNQYGTPWGPPGYSRKDDTPIYEFPDNFYFSDRKSARIFMDVVKRESGQDLIFSINDTYKS